MLDVVRVIALGWGLVRSLRSRSALSLACGLTLAYGLVVTAVGVAVAIGQKSVTGDYGLALVFLGTSLPSVEGARGLPGGLWMAAHPITRQTAFAVLAMVPFVYASRRSAPLRPESSEARRWDALASPFLLLATIDLSLAVLAAFMGWAHRPE